MNDPAKHNIARKALKKFGQLFGDKIAARQAEIEQRAEGVYVFGEHNQWAISMDDGCLQFHPQWSIAPEKKATHIWREAWEEVEKFGGFEAMRGYLRKG